MDLKHGPSKFFLRHKVSLSLLAEDQRAGWVMRRQPRVWFHACRGPLIRGKQVLTHHLARKKVYGLVQRLLHAWLGLAACALVVSGLCGKFMECLVPKQSWLPLHIAIGYGLTIGLVLRIVWGLVGPREARFSSMWHAKTWMRILRTRKIKHETGWGHDPLASAAYLSFYACVGAAVLSGLLLAAIHYDRGPWAEQFFDDFSFHDLARLVHNIVLYLLAAFIFIHIAALARLEGKRGYPIAQAMLSSYQYRPLQTEEQNREHVTRESVSPDAWDAANPCSCRSCSGDSAALSP